MKINCIICKSNINTPLSESVVLMCSQCISNIFHELSEDWKFEPTIPAGMYRMSNPKFTMSNMKQVDDKDNELPNYKITVDSGTKKTDIAAKRYYKKNRNFSSDVLKFDDPENHIGA